MLYRRIKIPNRTLQNYTIVRNNKSNIYLSNISSRIWELLEKNISIEGIVKILNDKYGYAVKNTYELVENILSSFNEKNLLENKNVFDREKHLRAKKIDTRKDLLKNEIHDFYKTNNFIRKVDLELTYRCNFDCRHCYNIKSFSNELSTEEWKNVMDQLVDLGCIDLAFTGGEVFTRKDFRELLKYACDKEFSIRIKTNGTLVTEEIAQTLKTLKPYILDIEISFYGTTEDIFDWYARKKGAFKNVCKAVESLKKNDIYVIGKYLIMKNNFHELRNVPSLMKNFGIPMRISSGSLIPRVDRDCTTLEFMISPDQQRQLIRELIKGSISPAKVENCDPAKTRCSISPDGNVCSCEWLSDIPFGNIKSSSLKNIWFFSTKIKNFRSIDSGKPDKCLDCSISQYCGRCPARAYLETGDLSGKSPTCCNIARMYSEEIGKKVYA